jgi:hypothetical protein
MTGTPVETPAARTKRSIANLPLHRRSGFTDFEGGNTHLIRFGPVGRPEAVELNQQISGLIPVLVALFEKGVLLPGTYDMIGKGGIDDILKAHEYYNSKKASANKVISKIWKE